MKLVTIITSNGIVFPASTVTEAETIFDLLGRLVSMSFVSTSGGGQPIQTGAESFCLSCATLILRSLNSQKPLPLKKYVLPVEKKNNAVV